MDVAVPIGGLSVMPITRIRLPHASVMRILRIPKTLSPMWSGRLSPWKKIKTPKFAKMDPRIIDCQASDLRHLVSKPTTVAMENVVMLNTVYV